MVTKTKKFGNIGLYITLLISGLLIFCSLQGAFAIDVNPNDSGGIQGAIDSASSGGTVNLTVGTYNKTNLDTNITINKNLTIQGDGSPDKVVIDGQKLSQIFTIDDGLNVTFINITFANGFSTTNGGAIFNGFKDTSLTFINCIFLNNSATASGGAIYNLGDNLYIENCDFDNNNAAIGGGVFTSGDDSVIEDSNFTKNSQAIALGTDNFTLINNDINGNDIAVEFVLNNFELYTVSGITSTNTIRNNKFAMGISGSYSNYAILDNFGSLNNGGIIFTNNSNFNSIFYSNLSNYTGRNDSWVIYFSELSSNNRLANSTIFNNTMGIGVNGLANNITGCTIINNTNELGNNGIVVLSKSVNATIMCNVIFNNTFINGFDLNDMGDNTNANYNWWGSNIPKVNASFRYWWVVNLAIYNGEDIYFSTINTSNSYYFAPSVVLAYELLLFDNLTKDKNVSAFNCLPYFAVKLTFSGSDGVFTETIDGREKYNRTTRFNRTGGYSLNVSADNENFELYGSDIAVNFTINKTVNVTEIVEKGDYIQYTVTVTNNGPEDASFVWVNETLPLGFLYDVHSANGTTTYNPITGVWYIGNLANGDSVTLIINGTVTRGGNITNKVTIYSDELNIGEDSAEVSVEVEALVNVTVNKTVSTTETTNGVEIQYVITVTNDGPDDATQVFVTEILDSRLVYYNSVASKGNYDPLTGVWYIGDLANGKTEVLVLILTINGTGNITNTVTVSTNEENTGNNVSNVTVKVVPAVDIVLIKIVSETEAFRDDELTYTIVVTNVGPNNATEVKVTDVLDPRLILLDINNVNNKGNFDSENGIWDIGNLAVWETVTLVITVKINGTGLIYNNVTVVTNETNIGDTNRSVVTNVLGLVNISINKTVNITDGSYVGYGDYINYTITVTNYGPDAATNVIVNDTLDYRLVYYNSSANKGLYNNTTGIWDIGSLDVGETVTLNITVWINGTGVIYNHANVTYNERNIGEDDDNTTVEIEVLPTVNITIIKSVNVTEVLNGDTFTYTIYVKNNGPDTANEIIIYENLDYRLELISSTSSSGTSYNSTTGEWNIGSLALGEDANLTLVVRVTADGNFSIINNTVTLDVNETNIGDDEDTVTLEVVKAVNLEINKTANVISVISGQEITYTITVTNNGPDNATNVVVTDILHSSFTNVRASPSSGTTYNSTTGEWIIGNLNIGETATLVITVNTTTKGTINNIANVTSDENNTGNNESNWTVNITPFVDLSVTKSTSATSVSTGDTFTYTITVTNDGLDEATNVYVTDSLDSRLSYLSQSSDLGSYNQSTGRWNIGNLAAGTSVTLNITVRVNSAGNGIIWNTAYANSTEDDGGSATVDVEVDPVVSLSVTKSVDKVNVTNGDSLLYIITVTNNGPDTATNVVVRDGLDSRLDFDYFMIWYYNYYSYSYESDNTIVWTIPSLANGSSATLYIWVNVNASGNFNNISNVANASSNENETNVESNEVNTTVIPDVRLNIIKNVNTTNAFNGDYLTYTITVTNNGRDEANNVLVTDILDSRLNFISSDPNTDVSYDSTNRNLTWNIGTLSGNGVYATLEIVVRVNGTGTISNTATVSSDETDDEFNTTETYVLGVVNLTINKTVDNENAKSGDYITYTITVTNNGPDNATNVVVWDNLDPRLIFRDVSYVSHGSYFLDGSWRIPSLNSGVTATLNLTFEIGAGGAGTIYNNATVTCNENNTGTNESETVVVQVSADVNLTIVKNVNTTNAFNGDYLTYTINVTNHGLDEATNVHVRDILDPRLNFEDIYRITVGTTWDYDSVDGLITWDIGTLSAGASAILEFYVSINASGNFDTIYNNATVSSDETDEESDTTETEVEAFVNLTITKTVDVEGLSNYNDTLIYTITVTNDGLDEATNVVVRDVLDSRLIYNDNYINGITDYKASYIPDTRTIIWNIDTLAPGSTVNLTINVTVNGSGNISNIANGTFDETGNVNGSEVIVEVLPVVDLEIIKAVNVTDGDVVLNGEYVNYTITVTNHGPDTATNVIVKDVLDSRLEYSEYSADVTVTYNESNGEWNLGNINSGDTVTLNIIAKIIGIGIISNNATVSSNETDEDIISNEVEFEVAPAVNITIIKTVNATQARNGDSLTYIINVTNNGPDNATNVIVTDVLDLRLSYENCNSDTGNCVYNPEDRTITWTIDELKVGDTVTLEINVTIMGNGNITNNATVTTEENNTGDENDTASTLVCDISINKTVSNANPNKGDEITYTITVTNNGDNTVTNIKVIDKLPDGLTYVSSETSNDLDYNPENGEWIIDSLDPGESETLNITVNVTGTGTITNTAKLVLESDGEDDDEDPEDSVDIEVIFLVSLEITKKVNVAEGDYANVGDTITYTINVTSTGEDPATGVVVIDILDSRLQFVSTNNDDNASHSEEPFGGTVTWNIGTLNSGESVELEISVIILSAGNGTIVNVATASASELEEDENSTEVIVEVVPLVDLSIIKSVDKSEATTGDVLVYTITVTNHGPDTATNVVVTDRYDNRLSITYEGDYTYVLNDDYSITWTIGELSVDGMIEIIYHATINSYGDGSNIINYVNVSCDENETDYTNNEDDETVILNPYIDISLTKSADMDYAYSGDTITYTITVTNNGDVEVTNVVVTDIFDSRLRDISYSGTYGYDISGNIITWDLLTLAIGQEVTITYSTTIDSYGDGSNIINYANVSCEEDEGNYTNNNDTVEVTLLPHFELSIVKAVNASTAVTGDVLKYTITVTNNGDIGATNVYVYDLLDIRLNYQDFSIIAGWAEYRGITYLGHTWYLDSIASGGEVVFEIYVNISSVGDCSIIYNNVTVNSTDGGNESNTVNTTVTGSVNLTILKEVNINEAIRGDRLEYNITITNNGDDIATNIVVTDILDSRLNFSGASGGTYNPTTRTLTWNINQLAVGNSATLYINVTINDRGDGNIPNTANITSVDQNNSGNNNSTVIVTVLPTVNLSIDKRIDDNIAINGVTNGDSFYYYIYVTNYGPDIANNIVVKENLDYRLELLGAEYSSGTTYNNITDEWSIPILYSGSWNAVRLTLHVQVLSVGDGTIVNTVNITDVDETNNGTNNSTVNVTVLPNIDLEITKTVNLPEVSSGDYITYTITVRNIGLDNATNVVVRDVLDSRLNFTSSSPSDGVNYNSTDCSVTWNISTLNVDATVELNITVQVLSAGDGVIWNTAYLSADDFDGDESSDVVNVNPVVNLLITKTVDLDTAFNGEQLTYVVTIRNLGPDNATGVVVSDVLDYRLTHLNSHATGGNFNYLNGTWFIGDMAVGDTVNLTINVTIHGVGDGLINNTANVTSNQGNNGTNNTTVNTTVLPLVNITLTKEVVPANVANGDVFFYIITVTNNGPDTATGVKLSERLDNRLVLLDNQTTKGTYENDLWDIGEIASGESYSMILFVLVIDASGEPIVNFVNISTNENNTGDKNASVEVDVTPSVDIVLIKVVNATEVLNGTELTYHIIVINRGLDTATGVIVTEVLDNRLTLISSDPSKGTYENDIWNIGNLTPNGYAVLTIIVSVNGTGTIVNTVNVTTDQGDTANATVETNITGPVDLSIVKSVNASSVVNGGLLTYTITVTNNGNYDATGVTVNEVLDTRLILLNNIPSQGTYDGNTWNIGNISVGNTVTLTLFVRVNGSGLIFNNVTVTVDQENLGNNESNVSTNASVNVRLSINKVVNATGKVFVGDILRYTITVSNSGLDTSRAIVVRELLPSGLVYVGSSSTKGDFNHTTGLWTIGNLDGGETVVLYVDVRVDAIGDITNRVTITSEGRLIEVNEDSSPYVLIHIYENTSNNGATNNNTNNKANVTNTQPDDDNKNNNNGNSASTNGSSNDTDKNKNNSGVNSAASMKGTALPVSIAIIVLILSILVLNIRRKE
ncbi:MAG: hypothetical protein FWE58_01450 [Methanobrevibacter sp.]|nr:hypothetical protein [Methanobrevibacter sp.]